MTAFQWVLLCTISMTSITLEYLIGFETMIVKKETADGNTVYATATREVFDHEAESKFVLFFMSGVMNGMDNKDSTWIAIKKTCAILVNTLFLDIGGDTPRALSDIEAELLQHCAPRTISQQYADWFLMRCFRITGTMADKFAQQNLEITVEQLQQWFKIGHQSWFKRTKSSQGMKEGTLNEVPISVALNLEPMVKDFYDIDLMQCKNAPFFAVLPDGVVALECEAWNVYPCVEIKTRIAYDSQQVALKAVQTCGRMVY